MAWGWKHIADITGPPGTAPAASTLYYKRDLVLGEDLDALRTPGIYAAMTTVIAASLVNAPMPVTGVYIVSGPTSGVRAQDFIANTGESLGRGLSITTGLYGKWDQKGSRGRALPNGTDVKNFLELGNWRVPSKAAGASMIGLPAGATEQGILVNQTYNGLSATSRFYLGIGTGTGVWYQALDAAMSTPGNFIWSEWMPLHGGGGGTGDVTSGHYGVPNTARIEDFKDAYPLVSTGGKGAVLFRWDHGLTNFKSELLPLHQQHGIPGIVAMNSRNWGRAENTGMTKAEAKALAAAGLIEWANHGADGGPEGTHLDASTTEGLWDQIVNGRAELETDLGIPIWKYIVPGTGGTGQGGLGAVSSLDALSRTYAGSIIMASHAVTSGYFPNTIHRKLDGKVRQGQSHWVIEQRTVAEVKEQIDLAVTNKTALCLMGHPRLVNFGAGYYTTAMLTEIFAYVNTKIQAGQLANISPLQSHHAKL